MILEKNLIMYLIMATDWQWVIAIYTSIQTCLNLLRAKEML